MRVLVVEDDPEVASYLTRGLTEHGWEVEACETAQSAMMTLGARTFDAIVLDRMLPGADGIDTLKLMRGAGIGTPVLMLTAMAGLDDRVAGLEAGADDYLGKPFAISEVVARLKSLARRPPIAQEATQFSLGDLHLDRMARQATRAGQVLDLSPLEFKLLEVMLQHVGQVVTRTMLLEKVWGYRFDPKTSLVQTHMSRMRAKLDKPFDTEMIRTVRGAGYVIDAPQ